MKRIFFFFFVSWRYKKKSVIRYCGFILCDQGFFFFFHTKNSSFLIIQYNRKYTTTEIIQTAFIFCIFNITLEFLKPLPLIFRNIYYITISRNFQH